ncbi:MAG: hypothetical protein ChlgKO_07730 [Chlamydiales bacterium]
MSSDINAVFAHSMKGENLPEDATYLGLTPSMIGKISLLITGLSSWIYFGGALYSLTQRKISLRHDATLLFLSSSVGYLTISFAKRVRHYDQRGSIISYKKEIRNRLKTKEEQKSLLEFIKSKHGWENIRKYKVLTDQEKTEVLRLTLQHENFFTAVKEYSELDFSVISKLWDAWSSQKTILELFEQCDFAILEKVLPNVYTDLKERKTKWDKAIQPVQRAYDAYRNQTSRDPSQECSEKQRRLITAFRYEVLLDKLKDLEKDFSCRPIEFF